MPKYLVETISQFRMRYVVECNDITHAQDSVVCEEASDMSQHNLGEVIVSSREINNEEYIRIFDEDNDCLKDWDEDQKFSFIYKVDYDEDIETDNSAWEFS
jgi:hypothetical protein